MNYEVYRMYAQSKKMVDKLNDNMDNYGEAELSLLAAMKFSHGVMEEQSPEYVKKYNIDQEMFSSFTREQHEFICDQIGWWYTLWKDRMWVHGKKNEHWLGRGKEDLKTMICGE